MSFTFSVVFFFPLNLESSEILVLIFFIVRHGSLIWFELKKKKKRIRENAMCVKLNLYLTATGLEPTTT